ncbi:MAG: hypothetical protein P8176_14535, partial [Gammaproteobacteria bacterium]
SSEASTGPATRESFINLHRSVNHDKSEVKDGMLEKSKTANLSEYAHGEKITERLIDEFMSVLGQTLKSVSHSTQKKMTMNSSGSEALMNGSREQYVDVNCTGDDHNIGAHNNLEKDDSGFGQQDRNCSEGDVDSANKMEALLSLLQKFLESVAANGDVGAMSPFAPQSTTPNSFDGPLPEMQGDAVQNTIRGGTGAPQRDMNHDKPGTQINVVLKNMSDIDRQESLEALRRWSEVSGGELEFIVHDAGQVPRGQDYIVMQSVEPDNTTTAGVADVGRSPDGVTDLEFESGSGLGVVMHEVGHTLGLQHSDGVLKAINAETEFSKQNVADLAALYPNINSARS